MGKDDDGGFTHKRVKMGQGPGEVKEAKGTGTKFENEGPDLSRGERIKGALRKAGGAAREGVRRAATYEPSKETKESVREVGQTLRREFQEAGDYYNGGKRARRGRTADAFGLGAWASNYSFYDEGKPVKQQFRETRTSVRRGRVTVVERTPYEQDSRGTGFDPYGADFSSYLDSFDPFKDQRRSKKPVSYY